MSKPKILLIDIETAPIEAYVWGIWDINVSLNQIKKDWSILSFAAKWHGSNEMIQHDVSLKKNHRDDKDLCRKLWKLLDEADIVVGQNSKEFDIKKIFARFAIHELQPPSTFRQIDTKKLASKHFAFTSNKLEYLVDKLGKKHKKMTKRKFDGMALWVECLNGNPEAWKEMREYNIMDVLTLEEVYHRLLPWDPTINFDVYSDDDKLSCVCGGKVLEKKGFAYTSVGKFQRYVCVKCGKNSRGNVNLVPQSVKKGMKRGITG